MPVCQNLIESLCDNVPIQSDLLLESRLSRRAFLTLTGGSSLALALHPFFSKKVSAQGGMAPILIEIPGASPLLYTRELQDIIGAGWGPLAVAGLSLHHFNQMYSSFLRVFDPRVSFGNLSQDAKMLLRYYRTAGGQNIWRSLPEARALYQKVPGPIRVGGVPGLKQFHNGKVWSHIVPRGLGGPDIAANGLWWSAVKNLRLGMRPMTWWHIIDARFLLFWDGIWYGLFLTLAPLLTASAVSMVIVGVMTILEFGLQYYIGAITRRDLIQGVFAATLAAGTGTFLFTGLLLGMGLAFPVLLPLLEVVVISLSVVGFVFLINKIVELGSSWWAALDKQGHLDQFLLELRILEEFLRGLSKSKTGPTDAFIQETLAKWSDWLTRLVPDMDFGDFIPQFDYARYFPDWHWSLPGFITDMEQATAQAIPEWSRDHLSSLDLNVREILSNLDLPFLDRFDLPVPNLGDTARSAQEALLSASAYIRSKGNPSPSEASG